MKKIKIFSIPYAGGSASMYWQLKNMLSEDLELIPIELSGHGMRYSEELNYSITDIVQDVIGQIIEVGLDTPFCLMGYSMGSLICYEVYYKLIQKYRCLPQHIFLCASDNPFAKRIYENIDQLEDKELIEKLKERKGTPDEVLNNQEIMDIVLPQIRADFTAYDNYYATRYKKKILTSATIINGDEEHKEENSIYEWESYFSSKCEFINLKGGHFFIFDRVKEVAQIINLKLKRY